MKNIFFLFLLAVNNVAGQAIENYLSVPFPTELTASVDGKNIAWVFNDKGSRNIYVAEASAFTTKKMTSYTGDDGMDINGLEFTPDGNQIVFVRGNPYNNSGEAANPAFLQTSTARNIWIINKDGSQLRKIVAGSNFKISPDGKRLAYTSQGQVWILSLTDPVSKPEKLFQSRGGQSQIRWSPDGTMIAFTSNRGDHSFIGVYHLDTKNVSFAETSMDNDTYPTWSPDGKQLAYIRIPNMNDIIPVVPVREGNPWSII